MKTPEMQRMQLGAWMALTLMVPVLL